MSDFPNASAPKPKKVPITHRRFGQSWTDNYAWMKDENWQAVMQDPSRLNPEIKAHLDNENHYSETCLEPLEALKADLFAEMKARLEPEARSLALPDGDYAYFHFFRKGDQHGVYARHDLTQTSPEKMSAKHKDQNDQIILDAEHLSQMSEGYFDLGDVSHSPDHKWLAYSVDLKGSETYTVYLKQLGHDDSSAGVETAITRAAGNLIWAADNQTIFWVERDENQRPFAVRYRNIFDKDAQTQTAYEEQDPGFFVGIGLSDDLNFIEISAHNHTSSEIWRIARHKPHQAPICFAPRQNGVEYSIHDQGGYSYILTNAFGATDFAIMRIKTPNLPVNGAHKDAVISESVSISKSVNISETPHASENWKSFIPHKSGSLILGLESFKHFLVRLERENALPRIVIRDMRNDTEHNIEMDEAAYALGLISGYEYDTEIIHYSYESPTTPRQVFAYNMATREKVLVKQQIVPSGHDPSNYITERLMITARDGENVPVTLLRSQDTAIDGTAPLLLYGYGSYGITISAGFRTAILSLVDRGFIYAIAHIRGGMAKGYQWYLDGKLAEKTNTFHDFIDTGKALIVKNYTAQGRIIAHGGSAGGMLVGAAVNQAPELFGGIIAAVPFVDVLNTMSDASLPLTPPEWPEWGNPIEDAAAFTDIMAYSPYENVKPQHYPPMLITAGLTDPRVTYWEPAKWAAHLRDNQDGPAPILFKVNMEAGHQGESGRYDSLKETALEYAFALHIAKTDYQS